MDAHALRDAEADVGRNASARGQAQQGLVSSHPAVVEVSDGLEVKGGRDPPSDDLPEILLKLEHPWQVVRL